MPVYTYRREDGSTFDIRQSFSDSALTQDPTTGQKVVRLVQRPGVIFKGSGFYVTDSKGSGKSAAAGGTTEAKDGQAAKSADAAKPADSGKTESTPSAPSTPTAASAAAD